MTQSDFLILENKPIASDVFALRLAGENEAITKPGQFVNLRVESAFLRRPISVCDKTPDGLLLVYKVVGGGTKTLSEMKKGEKLNLLVGLGNGFDTSLSGENPLVIGGGVGTPPLLYLTKALLVEGKKPKVVLGFNSALDAMLLEDFRALAPVTVTTADGSLGKKGFVTDAVKDLAYSYFYTCGPMPMFRALEQTVKTSGQFSFEERMGCGFGACMGCSCKTKYGNKRICRDGPVLVREEIVW